MGGRPIKPLPEIPEEGLTAQQAALFNLVRAGRTVREAAAELGIPAKQASKQLAAVRKKAGSFPPTDAARGPGDTPVPREAWQNEALALVEGRGLSPEEAARRLGQSPGTVRSLICRWRKNTGQIPRSKTACYRLGEEGYLPPVAHPGTGFGLRLRNCRRRAGVTPEQLADLGGITVTMLERLEKGEYLPDWRLGQLLCHALGVKLADMVVPCGRVELTRELVLRSGGMRAEDGRPKGGRGRAVRRLAAAGGTPVVLQGPGGSVVMHSKGGCFVLHLDRASRGRVKRVLADRRLRLLELTGDGGALYLSSSPDLAAVREELGRGDD
ncbi:MAG TPA: helix-turn-helix domain-containing protein [Spirochaetia bacterium]|nr:helix-turn-helix domain-containing protein [Spirochaetia bacterium]